MRLVWSPEARRNLLDIHAHIAAQTSHERADAVIERIRTAARGLLMVSRLGRKVQPENSDDFRVTHTRPFWIYYRLRPDEIQVVAVIHYRQDAQPS